MEVTYSMNVVGTDRARYVAQVLVTKNISFNFSKDDLTFTVDADDGGELQQAVTLSYD